MPTPLAITVGDASGIGPEVTLKALQQLEKEIDASIFCTKESFENPALTPHLHALNEFKIVPCLSSLDAIKQANAAICHGQCRAMVTAPIAKTTLQDAGLKHTGHTSYLQALTHTQNVSMAFSSERLKIVLNSIHIPISEVPKSVNSNSLKTSLDNAISFCKWHGIEHPRIAISGLNPHASENGMFGTEESEIIMPFISENKAAECELTGPYSPDTIFKMASDGKFDCVIALYHDQGLIPLKLLAFDTAVNVTVGLPYIRTSPDHGTAPDIVFQDLANPSAMLSAIRLAHKLSL
ncbi:MAG: 4-hydroxythreonine-4-phosphate dehydrogenase PdxA [bacterium]|nr:4-hydroxythreonine-4-phosphate dehydrogenase PdxA [bacterium]